MTKEIKPSDVESTASPDQPVPQEPNADEMKEMVPNAKPKVDVSSLLKPIPTIKLLNESVDLTDKLSISDKEMNIEELSQDNLLDSNLLLMNADDDINEEEDLLNSNLEDELLNSGNKVVNLLDDPITDDELEMKF